jgi:hypothetical protein
VLEPTWPTLLLHALVGVAALALLFVTDGWGRD